MDATTTYNGPLHERGAAREAIDMAPPGNDTLPTHMEAAARAFEAVPVSLAVLDRRGRLLCANAAARAEADFLNSLARNAASMARRASETNAPVGTTQPRAGSVLWVVAAPLPKADHETGMVLVTALDPTSSHPASTQLIAELCGLTPAEAQTARLILAGESPKLIARTLGVSLATVKTHLHRVFAKTGTSGQPDLARRLARIVTPRSPTAGDGAGQKPPVARMLPKPSPKGAVSDLTHSPAHPA